MSYNLKFQKWTSRGFCANPFLRKANAFKGLKSNVNLFLRLKSASCCFSDVIFYVNGAVLKFCK